jgi:hypothetical protein
LDRVVVIESGLREVKIPVYLRWGTQWNVRVPQSYLCLQYLRYFCCETCVFHGEVRKGTWWFHGMYAEEHACSRVGTQRNMLALTRIFHSESAHLRGICII